MSPAIITLCVLAVVALFFITEIIPLAVTWMSGAIALGLLGVIPEKQSSRVFRTRRLFRRHACYRWY